MECQYVATQRGGVALVFEGHRYNKVRDGKDGTVYWRCSRDRQCPGRAVTVNNRVKKANNKHNHPPEASLRNGTSGLTSVSVSSHHQQGQHPSATISSPSSMLGIPPAVASPLVAHHEAPVRLSSSHHHSSHAHHNSHPHLNLQDVLEMNHRFSDAQTAAAAAAFPSFPAIVTETLKYLAAASGNHQMAAAFATQMASLTNSSSLKDFGEVTRALSHRNSSPYIPGQYALSSQSTSLSQTFSSHEIMPSRP